MAPHTRHPCPWIETPLIESPALSEFAGCRVFLKLENLQPAGSFKSRGIGNFVAKTVDSSPPGTPLHFYTSSGGNAGLAAVKAAALFGFPSTIVVPFSTKPMMIEKLKVAGATKVIQFGASWQEADNHLRDDILAHDPYGKYIPPFDHVDVFEGASTMVDEIERQLAGRSSTASEVEAENIKASRVAPDVIISSVGGGGLMCGIAQGIIESPTSSGNTRMISVETQGAESLHAAIQAKKLISLPAITSIATSLGAIRVCPKALEYSLQEDGLINSIVVSDAEAAAACVRFADEQRVMVEVACGASLAVIYEKLVQKVIPDLKPDSRVVVVVCGGCNISLKIMEEYRSLAEAAGIVV